VTVTAPPRPPSPSDPVTHGEFDALVEALIEEARRRGQRRRRRNAAVVTLVALVGVALFALLGRSAQSQTASPALSARSSLPAAAANSHIAFISEHVGGGYCGVVYVMNPDGSGQRQLWQRPPPARPIDCQQDFNPAWSPDGRKIAIVSNPDADSTKSAIYVMNADGSGVQRLTTGSGGVSGAGGFGTFSYGSLAWSPDARLIAYVGGDYGNLGIFVTNADGSGNLRRLARNVHGNFAPPAWSPDGRRVAFVGQRRGNVDIYVVNTDGTGQRRLTSSAGRDSKPTWSPDGRRIAYESRWQVYVMNADGSGQRRLTNNGGRNFAPAWSPDGKRIVFERRRVGRERYGTCPGCGNATTFEVYVMNADGSDARKLAQDAAQPVWSPDGRKIAFEKIRKRPGYPSSKTDIYVMNADGSGQRNLTRHAGRIESSPVWSPAQR